MSKHKWFYFSTLLFFISLTWVILNGGGNKNGQVAESVIVTPALAAKDIPVWQHPYAIFLLQIIIILLVARLFSWLAIKLHQPSVIGEIIAGIVLGPSLIGLYCPEFFQMLFPKSSVSNLQFLSQVGLVLFMFIVGMELDMQILKRQSKSALIISHFSIGLSFFLGVFLASFLYKEFAPNGISFTAFALFMGITMSITAFPVLARIIQERGWAKTNLGLTVITCAAIDDITAWCLLAVVIAVVKAQGIESGLITIGLSICFILFMLFIARPILNKIANRFFTRETVNKPVVAFVFILLLMSAYTTELIGIHALFGAFLAGIIVPTDHAFREVISEKIEDISLVLLMPLFFAYTGLRTEIGLLNQSHLWLVALIVICVAISGKFFGGAIAAKFTGKSWKDSFIIGALLNTRGLMELIVLNIGLDLGVLSREMFTILVLMALLTTFITGPAIDLINFLFQLFNPQKNADENQGTRILLPFAIPEGGSRLLHLVHQVLMPPSNDIKISALHLTAGADVSIQEAKIFEKEGFEPILKTANELGVSIQTHYKVSDEVSREIVKQVNRGAFHWMFVGSTRSMFSKNEAGGRAKYFFEDARCPVGVLIDRGFEEISRVMILLDSPQDTFLLHIGKTFLQKPESSLTLWDPTGILKNSPTLSGLLTEENQERLKRDETSSLDNTSLEGFHLIIISLTYWNKLKKLRADWLNYSPSILIINK